MTDKQILASKLAHEKLRRRTWAMILQGTPSRYVVWRSSTRYVGELSFEPSMVRR